jgi:hypothetical protein
MAPGLPLAYCRNGDRRGRRTCRPHRPCVVAGSSTYRTQPPNRFIFTNLDEAIEQFELNESRSTTTTEIVTGLDIVVPQFCTNRFVSFPICRRDFPCALLSHRRDVPPSCSVRRLGPDWGPAEGITPTQQKARGGCPRAG